MQNQVREKNYIFKGPLTQSLTNEILCFFIAGFPMDAGMGRQWRRLGRQCRRSISARMMTEEVVIGQLSNKTERSTVPPTS